VDRPDLSLTGKIGDGTRQLENAVESPGRKPELCACPA
jgi:hypothetical protein